MFQNTRDKWWFYHVLSHSPDSRNLHPSQSDQVVERRRNPDAGLRNAPLGLTIPALRGPLATSVGDLSGWNEERCQGVL